MTRTLAAGAGVDTAVSDMWRSVLLFVPKFLAFLVILVVGWLVARLARKLVDRVLERIGFDRAVERGGIKAALARSRYDASSLVATLVYYGILLFTLQLAFGVWGPNPVSDLIQGIVAWLPKAFVAIVIVVVAAAIAAAVRDVVGNALSGLSYGRLLGGIAYWFIVGVGAIAALNQIGVATSVTTPILIAVLATVGGILVVGMGGGLVRPMQQRWERWLERASSESAVIAEHARSYREQAAPDGYAHPAPPTDWNQPTSYPQQAADTAPPARTDAPAGPAEPAPPARTQPIDGGDVPTDPAGQESLGAARTQPIPRVPEQGAADDPARTQPVRPGNPPGTGDEPTPPAGT
jgi:hypothetical protein